MAKTIDFTAKNVKDFTSWLKRFSSIEKSILIEVDEVNECFTAKSYNEEKSIVKYSKISFIDSGFTLKKASPDPQLIKVGIYNINQVIKSLDHFQSGEFSFSVKYDEIISGQDKNFAGIALLIKNPDLKVRIDCSALSVFKYISDDLFNNAIAKVEEITTFEISNITMDKINSLCDLDKEYSFIEFLTKDKKVFVRGRAFELDIADNGDEESKISIYKDQFNKIDVENYSVNFGSDKLVFISKDSHTVTVTSMVVKDERYEEDSMEF